MTRAADPAASDLPAHRPPRLCPVCAHDLVVTGLGCPNCGTGLSGAFRQCSFCGLDDGELEMLRVFLVSRGNMRELAAALRVSYPTARARFADLLGRLGLTEEEEQAPPRAGAAHAADPGVTADVLADLAAGRIGVEAAERLLRGGAGGD